MTRLLPREGLTLEAAFVPVQLTLFQPLLTGSLLAAILYAPAHLEDLLPTSLLSYILSSSTLLTLKTLFILGLITRANGLLSRLALNNFSFKKSPFRHGEEIAVITGGSNGLGEAIVHALSPSVRSIHVLDIVPPSKPLPSNAHFHTVDLASSTSITAAASAIASTHGAPSILVSNAATSNRGTLLSLTDAQIQRIFNVNVLSHFHLVQAFLPAMIKANHGHVVTVASMASYSVQAGNVDYGCTKAAVLAFHEGLGQELKWRYRAPGVRTTVVQPAYVRTPSLAPFLSQLQKGGVLILEPETVAEKIVNQLHSGLGAQLIMPERFGFATSLRGWPSWVQEYLRDGMRGQLDDEK